MYNRLAMRIFLIHRQMENRLFGRFITVVPLLPCISNTESRSASKRPSEEPVGVIKIRFLSKRTDRLPAPPTVYPLAQIMNELKQSICCFCSSSVIHTFLVQN